jgi:murein DD-endopeptidase MepM/ murein hydrolase activator NlpD
MKITPFKLLPAIVGLVFLGLFSGCGRAEMTPVVVQVFVTATPSATPVPSRTPLPTSTPTPTATATATALPIIVSGDPLADGLQGPTPAAGAFCGLVDTLDFPLEPPDAVGVRGGQDFGVYRQRFGKNHAGEDWGVRGASLGRPVYAIGHGMVTYADGLGWGADKGVVIIRHTFAEGGTILSFYGHLDPPSVQLQPGECVRRGQHIADIGDPISPPHLHFEIRSHMPHVPGPGYWPEDPTLVGWLPPSRFIWDYRAARTPGVLWTRYDLGATRPLGDFNQETFVALEGNRLIGLYTPGGGLRWTHELDFRPADALISADAAQVFTIKGFGLLEAFRGPVLGEVVSQGEGLVPVWQLPLEDVRMPQLAPLPGGGVAVFTPGRQLGVSAAGELLWQAAHPGRLDDWQLEGDALLASVGGEGGRILALDEAGAETLVDGLSGQLAADEARIFVLGRQGLYLLDRLSGGWQELIQLPVALEQGDVLLVPGEGVYALHVDPRDRRLIALSLDGALRWQRSLKQLGGEAHRLLESGGQVYLFSQERGQYDGDVSLFEVDAVEPRLALVFAGGTRAPDPRVTWLARSGGGLLLQIGGGSLVRIALRP